MKLQPKTQAAPPTKFKELTIIESARSGNWFDPKTWIGGEAPEWIARYDPDTDKITSAWTNCDVVIINLGHAVTAYWGAHDEPPPRVKIIGLPMTSPGIYRTPTVAQTVYGSVASVTGSYRR